MVGVCVGRVVQDDRLGEVPPEDAEIFDVVAENAGTIVLIQTMSKKGKHQLEFGSNLTADHLIFHLKLKRKLISTVIILRHKQHIYSYYKSV